MSLNTTPENEELEEIRDDKIVGDALRWSLFGFAVIAIIAIPIIYILTRPAPQEPVVESEAPQIGVRNTADVKLPDVPFVEITEAAGLDFRHENGASGLKLLPETMGGGCAFFDFDNDGDQDLLFVNSQKWPGDAAASEQATMQLYKNDGTGKFANVTLGSGLDFTCYGMGAAIGDYDNDGLKDVYITAVGENRLFHNEGEGKFREVTQQAGVAGDQQEWSTSAGWFDYDRDGDLDLFVCNYVKWSKAYDQAQNFQLTGGGRAYGRPQNFEGTFPYLFRNEGNGTFTEQAELAGLHLRNPATNVPMAKSLGVTFVDHDSDGWLDIIVANDTVQNFLFQNRHDGTFAEVGTLSGIAFDMDGSARGAMGIDASNFRNTADVGIAIGNFSNEMTALYVSDGESGQFIDEAISTGLGPATRLDLTFGVFFFDVDLDGRLDLFSANGHLEEEINRVLPSQFYEQPPRMFWNCGPKSDTEFVPFRKSQVGQDLLKPIVGRGATYADIDNDGDLDVLIATTGRTPRLLRNDQQLNHHWIRFSLTGKICNRDAIGTIVELTVAGQIQRQTVMPTKSYISQVEPVVTFGLGENEAIEKAVIHWPDGTKQVVEHPEIDRLHNVEQSSSSS